MPAQLVALSTSSSMATLPVTMDCLEERLEVDNEVVSFVCPVGATINMDATSLMQAIATVFVCQVLGHELAWNDQLVIVLTATLASIGAAGAPSAGIVMLVIVLESVGFPSEKLPLALAMILAVDRPLDMCRTVVNVTGDACVAVLVGASTEVASESN
jgi:Na+/H+-dicarboxylate symporter